MRFANPQTGYTESRSWAGVCLCAFFFGGLYCLYAGLWAAALVWAVIAIALYAALGPAATVLMLFMAVIYAAVAPSLVRASYLRKGWVELPDDSPDTGPDIFVKCPFCAETIRSEAIKCKHCGSELPQVTPATPATPVTPATPGAGDFYGGL